MKVAISIILLFEAGVSFGLRLSKLQVPKSVKPGSTVALTCLFTLENDILHSIKWYKDDVLFFKHVPKDTPQNRFFSIGDIEVDESRTSYGTSVYLKNIAYSAEGIYKCEVTAEAAAKRSASEEAYMAVEGNRPSADIRPRTDPPRVKSLSSSGPKASWLLLLIVFLYLST